MKRLRLAALLLASAALLGPLRWSAAVASEQPPANDAAAPRFADFGRERASPEARHVADWAVRSGDSAGMPFIVVDKVHARLFVFDTGGQLRGASPVLIGLARGDESVPGIGSRQLSTIRPDERTTPAGRFVASLDRALNGDEILWVDYDSGVALHRVIATQPKERRLQRLESTVAVEHRITYGCINVPVKFYDTVVSPTFTGTSGIVYVLPETRSAREVFGSYEVGEAPPAPRRSASPPAAAAN